MPNVWFTYEVGDRVIVKAIDTKGFIDRVSVGSDDTEYRVNFWLNGKRCQEWMYAHELKGIE